ncbi:MAG: PAS domain S-box protein [Deltaproteobacteria bacterium]|nr:PAS domain S-box protein [Deltaproteobacteria bacterium]
MNEKILQEMDWRVRVFDSLSFPTLIIRPDKSILTANQIFLERRSLEVKQIVGKKCHEVFYGEKICPNTICPLKKVIAEKKGQSIIRRTQSLTGKQIWEDRVFSPILDEDGNVDCIMESVRDITRLKNLEVTLKEAEAFLEKIIHGSPVAIMAADRYANILLMNPAAEDLFGYTRREAITRISVENLYPGGTAKGIMKQLRSRKQGGKGKLLSTNTTILNADGEEIPVELNASIIYEDDSEVATVGIYKDLRTIMAMEEKLKKASTQIIQSEKLASLGKLAAGVAHEINNPLTGILLYANMVLDSMDANDAHRKKLQNVVEDANRCSDIVKNLLAYSRQTNPTKKILALNTLVDESLALIRDQKLFMHIKLRKSFTPEEMHIQVDKNQMAQVIINLVMNAVDAMDKKGILTLRTYRTVETGTVCLEISDTGCGIPENNLPKIFDPFFTTKALGQGTGLGLSTVYGIIKENHGEISVKETGSQGTTFIIQFPEHTTTSGGAFL